MIIIFLIILCFSSTGVISPAKPPVEALSCDPNEPGNGIIRIWVCKHRECHRQCFAKYGSGGTKVHRCIGRDTCDCCFTN